MVPAPLSPLSTPLPLWDGGPRYPSEGGLIHQYELPPTESKLAAASPESRKAAEMAKMQKRKDLATKRRARSRAAEQPEQSAEGGTEVDEEVDEEEEEEEAELAARSDESTRIK